MCDTHRGNDQRGVDFYSRAVPPSAGQTNPSHLFFPHSALKKRVDCPNFGSHLFVHFYMYKNSVVFFLAN